MKRKQQKKQSDSMNQEEEKYFKRNWTKRCLIPLKQYHFIDARISGYFRRYPHENSFFLIIMIYTAVRFSFYKLNFLPIFFYFLCFVTLCICFLSQRWTCTVRFIEPCSQVVLNIFKITLFEFEDTVVL